MFNILIDTCVWLNLAKDTQQQHLLNIIEELVERNELSLIVPRTVIEEFDRNKDRILKESKQSLTGVLSRVKEAIEIFGSEKQKKIVLNHLSDVEHKIPLIKESTIFGITRIENLLKNAQIIETTDDVKLKAAQRAIESRAPFHRKKNSINDAIIIEIYNTIVTAKNTTGNRFGFVTYNKADFSDPNNSDKKPHPDFAHSFSKIKSLYFINLSECIQRIRPDLISEMMIEQELFFQPRSLSEILEAEDELVKKVWYNRHQIRAYKIANGKIKIIEKDKFSIKNHEKAIVKEIWEGALKAAKKVEKKYGIENLGPWDDFEWGMINGKLSALRWVTGDDWDMLDT